MQRILFIVQLNLPFSPRCFDDPGTGWQCPAAWSLMCVEDAGSSCIVHEVLEGHMRSVLDCISVPESFLRCCVDEW